MRISSFFTGLAAVATLTLSLSSASVRAADVYPIKPIRMIVPFAPGGAADILGRVVGDYLQRELGQPMVMVNRDGAGTIIGVDAAAKSAPDGYTLLISGDAATVNTASNRKLPYDLMRDLQPISLLYAGTQFLLVNNNSPYKNIQDLVKFGKANPGAIRYGSTGIGTSTHMSAETFNTAAGIKTVHIPYRGVAPAMNDLGGGHVDYVIAGSTAAIPAIKSGQLRALAITGRNRSAVLPDLPTFIEQGVNAETGSWYGLFVPAGTPPEIVARLHAATAKALANPELGERLKQLGGEARLTAPEQTVVFMRGEIQKFGNLMRELNIKLVD